MCGQVHGLGNMNMAKITETAGVKTAIYDSYAGTYISNEGDSLTVFRKGDSLELKNDIEGFKTRLLPISKTEYVSVNLPYDIKFGQDKKSKATTLSYHMFDDVICEKIK